MTEDQILYESEYVQYVCDQRQVNQQTRTLENVKAIRKATEDNLSVIKDEISGLREDLKEQNEKMSSLLQSWNSIMKDVQKGEKEREILDRGIER